MCVYTHIYRYIKKTKKVIIDQRHSRDLIELFVIESRFGINFLELRKNFHSNSLFDICLFIYILTYWQKFSLIFKLC